MRLYFNGMPIFTTQINDILCYCVVTHFLPSIPDKVTGAWEDAEMGSGQEFEYMLLDSRYIRAPWLQKQVDYAIESRLADEYECTVLEFKHYIDED